jgi:predicted DNA-binding transcriptional regulator YafY
VKLPLPTRHRIVSMEETSLRYIENTTIDFNEYFEDVIGVTLPKDTTSEKVVLFVTSARWPYIMTKPIHGSQKPPRNVENGVIVELDVVINQELISRILSYGKDVIVLEPSHLVDRIKDHIRKLFAGYS